MGDAYDYGEYQQRDFSVPLKRTPVHVLTDERLNAIVAQRCAPLVEALEVAEKALHANKAAWLTLAPALSTPYPDDPRWTPWTRFGERAGRAAWDAGDKVREALAAHRAQEKAGGAEADRG
jgi:hypothetical protein